jgi:hypothetical protein
MILRALSKLFQKPQVRERPFLAHPDEGDKDARTAIARLFHKLDDAYPMQRTLILSAQGQGARLESYHVVNVEYRDKCFDLGKNRLSLAAFNEELVRNGTPHLTSQVHLVENNILESASLSATELAGIAAALGIKPFDDDNDFPFVAEWKSGGNQGGARIVRGKTKHF